MATRCPVCGMKVDEQTAPAKTTHAGREYYFCSEACEQKFEANREQYAQP
jgi:P-type Cu+ transporter